MKHAWRWLVVVMLFGTILRLIGFGSVPVSPYWDEMAIWNDARSIITTGLDMHARPWFQPLFISYGDFKLPVYIWLTAIASIFTSDILLGVRLTSLLAGILTIPGVYILMRHLPNQSKTTPTALFAAVLAATLPWSLHFSRVGFEGHVSAVFLLWSVATSVWAIKQKNSNLTWWGLLAGSLLGSLAIYSYFSTRFVFPVVFLAPLFLWWPTLRRHWIKYSVAFVIWLLLLIPMYRADFYKESNQFRLSAENVLNQPDRLNQINYWRQLSDNTQISRLFFNRPTFIAKELAVSYATFLTPEFLFFTGDQNLRHGLGITGLLWIASAPLLFIGIAVLARHDWRLLVFLALWWVAAVLPAAVPLEVPHALRSLNGLPVFVLLMAIGGEFIWKTNFRAKFPILGLLILLLSVEILRFYHFNLKVYPQLSANHWQDGYLQSAEYIRAVRNDYDRVYVDGADRFFLYYLPYSELSHQQIQSLPTQDFSRNEFDNVLIGTMPQWSKLPPNSLVITTPDQVPADFAIKDSINGAAGKEQFVVVESDR